jgi:hypothetical protein
MLDTEGMRDVRPFVAILGAVLAILLIPLVVVVACVAIPYILVLGWARQHREHRFRMRMKSRGRLMPWAEFVRTMRASGGTCIEERFTAKGPVRFWWTSEDLPGESPYPIIDWFTMRKGRSSEPFIHWCRERYTAAAGGSAVLVDTGLVAQRDIYALWSECRSHASLARWVEVAPPEIVPHRAGDSTAT